MPVIYQTQITRADGQKISIHMGSVLHGMLIERLDSVYGAFLHQSALKPISQYVLPGLHPGTGIWRIAALDDQAEEALTFAFKDCRAMFSEHKKTTLSVQTVEVFQRASYEAMVAHAFGEEEPSGLHTLFFETPCTFKKDGVHQLFPSMELIYKSLMNRWDAFCKPYVLNDLEALEHLKSHTHIASYQLKSASYQLEGVRISGFKGRITLKISGPLQLKRLGALLFSLAPYSGIGIKTALGMGGITDENSTHNPGRRHRPGQK